MSDLVQNAWNRTRRLFWLGTVSCLLIHLYTIYAWMNDELDDWTFYLILYLVVLPVFASLLGARAFSLGGDDFRTSRLSQWLARALVGLIALLVMPVPALAFYWWFVLLFSESLDTPALLEHIAILALVLIFYATALGTSSALRRFWLSAATGYFGSFLILAVSVALVGEPLDSRHQTAWLVLQGSMLLVLGLAGLSLLVFLQKERSWSKRVLSAGLVFLLIAAGFVGFSQRSHYQREKLPLVQRLRESQARLEMARVTAARLDEFRREFTKRESELTDLRSKLPSELGVESFMVLLEEWAGESGAGLEVHDVESERYEFYEEALIPVVLHGTRDALSALMERRDELQRFVLWTNAEQGEDTIHVQLRIFAADFTQEEKPHPCSEVESPTEVWLWPYAEELVRIRAELDELCEECSRLKLVDTKVQEYRRILRESEALSQVLEHLKKE